MGKTEYVFVFSFRFSPPEVLKVARDVDYKMLQRDILKHMADCVKEGLISQVIYTQISVLNT
jgi:hypothetical protein